MIIKQGNINRLGKFQKFQYEMNEFPEELKEQLIKAIEKKLEHKLEHLEGQIILDGYVEVEQDE